MPLSEYEQRVLAQLEQQLGADPKITESLARPVRSRARDVLSILGVILGLGIVVIGAFTQLILVGLLGFVVMTGCALYGVMAPPVKHAGAESPAPKVKSTNKFEDRFERRRREGDF